MKKYYKLVISLFLVIFVTISFKLVTKTVDDHKASISTSQFYTDDGLGSVAANDYAEAQSSKYDKVTILITILDVALMGIAILLIISSIIDSIKFRDPFSTEDDPTDNPRSSYGK